ncbi:hypothetical protein PV327_002387 [Microctonus hyperodae]|uniref:Uncharacterized protein n=1 Tax=Microctonus hyperodae TaxID=165561 RepID=A0AA39KP18_MICHY|nr:hypothetical protein PV327_002387 [Microctonus hyperodae]
MVIDVGSPKGTWTGDEDTVDIKLYRRNTVTGAELVARDLLGPAKMSRYDASHEAFGFSITFVNLDNGGWAWALSCCTPLAIRSDRSSNILGSFVNEFKDIMLKKEQMKTVEEWK